MVVGPTHTAIYDMVIGFQLLLSKILNNIIYIPRALFLYKMSSYFQGIIA